MSRAKSPSEIVQVRRPTRSDTFDLRNQLHPEDSGHSDHYQHNQQYQYEHSDEEDPSLMEEDDMEGLDGGIDEGEFEETSSSLSIPNESIDFDLVYAFHSFAATVEGQANVVKGDSLRLMDDSNSYWWLVSVLNTQEIGYIPAENIETPLERLARLNKHRNVDLASATQQELQDDVRIARERLRRERERNNGGALTPQPDNRRSVIFRDERTVHNYLPAIWHSDEEYEEGEDEEDEEEEDEMMEDAMEEPDHDRDLVESRNDRGREQEHARFESEADDGMTWDDAAVEQQQQQQVQARMRAQAEQGRQQQQQQPQQVQQQVAQQQQQQQQQQQPQQQQQQQQQIGLGPAPLRNQTSRERLINQPQQSQPQQNSGQRAGTPQPSVQITLDPAEATETKRITLSPTIVRDAAPPPRALQPAGGQPAQQQRIDAETANGKRYRDGEPDESNKRPVRGPGLPAPRSMSSESQASSRSNTSSPGGAKLRKERSGERISVSATAVSSSAEDEKDASGDKDKKKKGGMLSNIFSRKRQSSKSEGDRSSAYGSVKGEDTRRSEESGRSSSIHGSSNGHREGPGNSPSEGSPLSRTEIEGLGPMTTSPTRIATTPGQGQDGDPNTTPKGQQRNSTDPRRSNSQTSQHALKMAAADQAQQALYQQQYLSPQRSGSTDGKASVGGGVVAPSYGLQSASAFLPGSVPNSGGTNSFSRTPERENSLRERQRPGSLVLSPTAPTGAAGANVPELTVIRVFAGPGLQTEATFKTVLLNSSTTSDDLIKQAMQRFRLAQGEDPADYFLTIKQLEGSSAELKLDERPLKVFEGLVDSQPPRVNRNSVGSISSVASNLSMHPAIKKLPMNDFTDDSAVKFYLNRRGVEEDIDRSLDGEFGEEGTMPPPSPLRPRDTSATERLLKPPPNNVSVPTSLQATGAAQLSPERFNSPSVRFQLQLVIFPEDLPDGMVFDTMTEAIIPRAALRERTPAQAQAGAAAGISQVKRRKVLGFPRNTYCAEVIEVGLERFGIPDSVVDGGDDVDDKVVKRRSYSRVRYGLGVQIGGQERMLQPTSKVIEAFVRPPVFREADRGPTSKRRSADAGLLLGMAEDIQPEDPVFVLRRVGNYRLSGSQRSSAPLDEVSLRRMQRDSSQSSASASISEADGDDQTVTIHGNETQPKPPQLALPNQEMSTQELIAAQRAASRATQRAILSSNGERGVDVLLPDRAVLRSSQYDSDNKMRYSYVEPDGGTYDISDIIEEELRSPTRTTPTKDLLEGVLVKDSSKLDRVLNRVKDNRSDKNSSLPNSASTTSGAFPSSNSDRSNYSQGTATPPLAQQPPPQQRQSPTHAEPTTNQQPVRNVISPVQRPSRLASAVSVVSEDSPVIPRQMSPVAMRDTSSPIPNNLATRTITSDSAARSASPSVAGVARDASPTNPYISRDPTPVSRYATPVGGISMSSRTNTPTPMEPPKMPRARSGTPNSANPQRSDSGQSAVPSVNTNATSLSITSKIPPMPADHFGVDNMLAIIYATSVTQRTELPEITKDPVELSIFGPKVDYNKYHPAVIEVYGDSFKKLAEMDKQLDMLMAKRLAKAKTT